jgi:hypothetical protein
MQFLRCPSCGFENEVIDTACTKCGADISRVVPEDAEAISAASQFGASSFAAAGQWESGAENDYPFARRFAGILRTFAKIYYVISIIGLAIGVIALLIAGFAAPAGSALGKAGSAFGGIIGAVLLGGIGFLFIWLIYVAMMATPDLILCLLSIERNTRRRA